MPRGRHRQAPPLHRLIAPTAVAASALLCAGGGWLVAGGGTGTLVLQLLATGAAAAATAGAVLLRRWDREAGKRVGEVRAAKATAEWRAEERQAELEDDLEESREIRRKVETELREKRAELAALRTEHAALLRRYATAETERAGALESRRQTAVGTPEPARALPAGAAGHRQAPDAPTPLAYLQADEALGRLQANAARQRRANEADSDPASGPDFDFFGRRHRTPTGPPPAPVPAGRDAASARRDREGTQGEAPRSAREARLRDTRGDGTGAAVPFRVPRAAVGRVVDLEDAEKAGGAGDRESAEDEDGRPAPASERTAARETPLRSALP